MSSVDLAEYENTRSVLLDRLGQEQFQACSKEGAQLSLDAAIELSYDVKAPTAVAPIEAPAASNRSYPCGLTRREVELLRLVALGLSNAELAKRLFLSSNTVRAHLYSIYNKINVTSRTGAAHFAVEHQLV
jgi:DNA-binding NarL/FixJ family response regulator